MMAGPTTQASTPIGTVTDAQMARIFVKEYCLVSAAPSTRAGNVCVFAMYFSVAGEADSAHRPHVPNLPQVVDRADDAHLLLRDDVYSDLSAPAVAPTTTDADKSGN